MGRIRRPPTSPNSHPTPHAEHRYPPLVEWLSTPAAYSDGTQAVRLVETHISWVFLTDRFAYKLKKPVKFDFLDFSTLERRRQACNDEVRLNRRMAPHVYLGLVPVRQDSQGQFRLDENAIELQEVGSCACSIIRKARRSLFRSSGRLACKDAAFGRKARR